VSVFEGTLEGFFAGSRFADLKNCANDTVDTFEDIKSAVSLLEKKTPSSVLAGLKDLGKAYGALKDGLVKCKAAEAEIQAFVKAIEQFKTPEQFAFHVGKDLLVNGRDIYAEVKQAVADFKSQNYLNAGVQIGEALNKLIVGTEFAAPPPKPTPLCFHMEDVEDHKCFEACNAEGKKFATKGIDQPNGCPGKYNTVDSTKTVLQCPDGITNVRYCTATALNVTIATKGEAGVALTAAPVAYVHMIETSPGDHCLEVAFPGGKDSPFWKSDGWKYGPPVRPEWVSGACDQKKWTSKDSVEKAYDGWTAAKNSPYAEVVMTKYGYGHQMAAVRDWPFDRCYHKEDANKCYQACSDDDVFKGFEVKGLTTHGACPEKYSSTDKRSVEHVCEDGVTSIKYCKADGKHIIQVEFETKGEK
jgi:hypothetical protein